MNPDKRRVIFERFRAANPHPTTELEYTTPFELLIAVILSSTFHATKHAVPIMKAQGRGRIVNIASAHGLVASALKAPYCAAKFGVVGFTRALAAELAGEVGVTLLIPGGMHTPFFDGRTEQAAPAVRDGRRGA